MSANGQQYTADDTRFVQYPPPRASTLLPRGGPDQGGTTVAVSGPGLPALNLTLTLTLTPTLTLTLTLTPTPTPTLTLSQPQP